MENVVTVLFNVESEAYQALSELKKNLINDNYNVYQAAIVKKENGKLISTEEVDTGEKTLDDTLAGGLIGSLVGMMGGPLGVLLGISMGSLIGSSVDTEDLIDNVSMFEIVSDKLEDGNVAIILLAQEENEEALNANFDKYQVTIIRRDAAVVLDEVEQANKVQEEMEREARRRLHEEKKSESKQRIQEKRNKIKADFAAFKEKIKNK